MVSGQLVTSAVAHVLQQLAHLLAGFVKPLLGVFIPFWDKALLESIEVYGIKQVLYQFKLGVVYAFGSHVVKPTRFNLLTVPNLNASKSAYFHQ